MADIKYLISQEIDHRWGIVTTTVGLQEGHPGVPYPYGEHPRSYVFSPSEGRTLHEYTMVYIIKGRGWFMSAHCPKTRIQAGDAFLLFPGEWHSYSPEISVGWTEAWVGFSGFYVDHLVQEGFFAPERPVFHVGVSDALWDIFSQAYRVATMQTPAYHQQLAGLVTLILSTIYTESSSQSLSNDKLMEQINMAKKYMREHLDQTLPMETVAYEVGLGYSKFRKAFKAYTGFSPARYFLELRMAKSKEMLQRTDLSCKEIAYRMGFESASYFHELFRRTVGMTPESFRKRS